MITKLAHVCLSVRDIGRTVAYYQKLGFKPKFRFTRGGRIFGAYLEISEGNYIEVFENKDLDSVVNTGLAHFCLESPDIDTLMEKLREEGVEFTAKKLGCDQTYQIWLKDPDGNSFEIHQYTNKSSQLTGETVEADW